MLRLKKLSPFHVKQLVPSLKMSGETVTMSKTDFRKLMESFSSGIKVDEKWYLDKYPDVKRAVERKEISSGRIHFYQFGFAEGRIPHLPNVDETWYLAKYPDVAEGVKAGKLKSASQHFMEHGAYEGRFFRSSK